MTVSRVLLAFCVSLAVACGGSSPTSPSPAPPPMATAPPPAPAPTPAPPTPTPPPTTVSLTGRVSSQAGARLSGATVAILDGANVGRTTATDSNGEYRFADLRSENANLSATASSYLEARAGVFVNGTNTLNFVLRTVNPWSQSGSGNTVFDMPTYLSRVRVVGTFSGFCQNFIVRVAGRLLVNEILGSCSVGIGTRYDGTHLTSGGVVEITGSSGIAWTFTEVR